MSTAHAICLNTMAKVELDADLFDIKWLDTSFQISIKKQRHWSPPFFGFAGLAGHIQREEQVLLQNEVLRGPKHGR